jgi:hypothetical protein
MRRPYLASRGGRFRLRAEARPGGSERAKVLPVVNSQAPEATCGWRWGQFKMVVAGGAVMGDEPTATRRAR